MIRYKRSLSGWRASIAGWVGVSAVAALAAASQKASRTSGRVAVSLALDRLDKSSGQRMKNITAVLRHTGHVYKCTGLSIQLSVFALLSDFKLTVGSKSGGARRTRE